MPGAPSDGNSVSRVPSVHGKPDRPANAAAEIRDEGNGADETAQTLPAPARTAHLRGIAFYENKGIGARGRRGGLPASHPDRPDPPGDLLADFDPFLAARARQPPQPRPEGGEHPCQLARAGTYRQKYILR